MINHNFTIQNTNWNQVTFETLALRTIFRKCVKPIPAVAMLIVSSDPNDLAIMWTYFLQTVLFTGFTLLTHVNITASGGSNFVGYISSLALSTQRYGAALYGYQNKLAYVPCYIILHIRKVRFQKYRFSLFNDNRSVMRIMIVRQERRTKHHRRSGRVSAQLRLMAQINELLTSFSILVLSCWRQKWLVMRQGRPLVTRDSPPAGLASWSVLIRESLGISELSAINMQTFSRDPMKISSK